MRFEVEVAGLHRTIEVSRAAGGWVATIDKRRLSLDVASSGAGYSLLLAEEGRPWSSHDVRVERGDSGTRVVSVDGQQLRVALLGYGRPALSGERSRGLSATEPVRAPMPGRVVKVLVAPGDAVEARQGLVVVEAMKMENELRASGAGSVAEVRVREGQAVEAGAILVVLEGGGTTDR